MVKRLTQRRDEHGYEELASLSLHGVESESHRLAIARWLEHQADELRRAGEEYAPHFTAGYWERRER